MNILYWEPISDNLVNFHSLSPVIVRLPTYILMVMAAQEAAAVAAEQASALPSDRTTTAEQADSSPPAKVDAAVRVDVPPKPAALVLVGHADAAVQIVCPAQGQQVLLPLYGMQAASLPPPHQPLHYVRDRFYPNQDYNYNQDSPGIPQVDGAIANSSEWSCKCCQ